MREQIPDGNKIKIVSEPGSDWYKFGVERFYFMKGEDGELYAKNEKGGMRFDTFIELH